MKMSAIPKKIFIQVEREQQENIKNSRKTLKTIQTTGTDKENLVGRLPAFIAKEHLIKPISIGNDEDLKRKNVASSSSQTLPASSLVTEEDLTSESTVSDAYWETLAEKRRLALEETLEENEYLHEKCDRLESELNQSKLLLDETRELVNVLTEMLQEKENDENEHAESETQASQQSRESNNEDALANEISDTDEEPEEDECDDSKHKIICISTKKSSEKSDEN